MIFKKDFVSPTIIAKGYKTQSARSLASTVTFLLKEILTSSFIPRVIKIESSVLRTLNSLPEVLSDLEQIQNGSLISFFKKSHM